MRSATSSGCSTTFGGVRDHAGQDDLPVVQLHVPPDLPLVLVPRVGRLERVRAGVDREQDVLEGAEAVLTLRAVISNGDFGEYWRFHLAREHQRL